MVRLQPVRQVVYDVPEYDRVDVVAEHVEQHPIAQLGPANDVADGLPFDKPKPHAEQIHAHPRRHDYNEPGRKQIKNKKTTPRVTMTVLIKIKNNFLNIPPPTKE